MNDLEKALYRKKVSILEACNILGLDPSTVDLNLETCSHCSIWFKSVELILDLDGNPICKLCNRLYGL